VAPNQHARCVEAAHSWKAFFPEGLNENWPLSVLTQTWYHAWA